MANGWPDEQEMSGVEVARSLNHFAMRLEKMGHVEDRALVQAMRGTARAIGSATDHPSIEELKAILELFVEQLKKPTQ